MDRPGFLFCVCPDGELIRQHIDGLLKEMGGDWRRKTFWGDEELPDEYWQALTVRNLLGESRAVVLRRAEALTAGTWSKFHKLLSAHRPEVWPFFCLEKEWSKGRPDLPAALTKQKFWAVAQKFGWVWQSPGLTRQGLRGSLKDWASARGIRLSGSSLETAVNVLPLDAAFLKNELDKLELWTADKKAIEPEDLSILSFQPDMDIFAFLTALESGGQDREVWRKVLRSQLEAESGMIMPFLGLMLREARTLWQLLSGDDQAVRIPSKVKETKRIMARRLGRGRLASLWTLVLEAETNIKSGQLQPAQAFEELTLGLMDLFSCKDHAPG